MISEQPWQFQSWIDVVVVVYAVLVGPEVNIASTRAVQVQVEALDMVDTSAGAGKAVLPPSARR